MDDQAIGLQIFHGGIAKEHEGGATKLDDDFRGAAGEAFAGAQVKGNAGPAPVVDLKLEGDKGLGVGFGGDVRLAAIAVHGPALDSAGTVLAADHAGEHVFGVERLDGVENFRLLVANFVGVEGDGRLHGGHGQQLEEMIGHHVAEGAGGFVEAAAMLHADGFRGRDLHVVYVVAIP